MMKQHSSHNCYSKCVLRHVPTATETIIVEYKADGAILMAAKFETPHASEVRQKLRSVRRYLATFLSMLNLPFNQDNRRSQKQGNDLFNYTPAHAIAGRMGASFGRNVPSKRE
jgi:hypothetical protein